jgi:hypothetical protein|eukprot:COSAG01_NODE_8887_length_2626_cov_2.205382_4_plen_213_part_00
MIDISFLRRSEWSLHLRRAAVNVGRCTTITRCFEAQLASCSMPTYCLTSIRSALADCCCSSSSTPSASSPSVMSGMEDTDPRIDAGGGVALANKPAARLRRLRYIHTYICSVGQRASQSASECLSVCLSARGAHWPSLQTSPPIHSLPLDCTDQGRTSERITAALRPSRPPPRSPTTWLPPGWYRCPAIDRAGTHRSRGNRSQRWSRRRCWS